MQWQKKSEKTHSQRKKTESLGEIVTETNREVESINHLN